MIDRILFFQLLALLVGLLLSCVIEQLLIPRPAWRRPLSAWASHAGLWLLAYAALLLLLERPWFAMALLNAGLMLLVQVNNAKYRSLQEPFVFQDYEYFTDAIRHPRLYIPFLGWGKFFVIVCAVVLALVAGLLSEQVPHGHLAWDDRAIFLLSVILFACVCVTYAIRHPLTLSFLPAQDIQQFGFFSCLWSYGSLARQPLSLPVSAFSSWTAHASGPTPHLVVVQSESFFDARRLSSLVREDVLKNFDQMQAESLAYGRLQVPAWGANTVRSEFAFLSGQTQAALGIHRFNPYQAMMRGDGIETIASVLKSMGYKTVCIHPYHGDFYQRNRVLPKLGFDYFYDIASFAQAAYYGPYVSDMSVAEKIRQELLASSQPVFIYAITMENHGPLHLETVTAEDVAAAYDKQPPAGFEDLTIYLKHLRQADAMAGYLMDTFKALPDEVGLCWFGDHVPIMPKVYQALGIPNGEVDFVLWSNRQGHLPQQKNMQLDALANCFLASLYAQRSTF